MKSPTLFSALILIGILLLPMSQAHADGDRDAILALLMAQADDWNRGDVHGFMEGYIKEERLRFASGGTVTRGWQATLARYLTNYATPELMGQLTFSNLEIDVLSSDRALVFGRFDLERVSDHPWGLFTLLLEKTGAGWKIASDHTSAGN